MDFGCYFLTMPFRLLPSSEHDIQHTKITSISMNEGNKSMTLEQCVKYLSIKRRSVWNNLYQTIRMKQNAWEQEILPHTVMMMMKTTMSTRACSSSHGQRREFCSFFHKDSWSQQQKPHQLCPPSLLLYTLCRAPPLVTQLVPARTVSKEKRL